MKNQRLFHRAREKGLRAIFAMLCVLCTLTQVQRNCTQSLQADAKRGCIQKRKTWFSFSHSLFNKGTNKRRECENDVKLQWRLSKISKWKELHERNGVLICPDTCRSTAELCGRFLFWLLTFLSPLGSLAGARCIISIVRRVGAAAFTSGWDAAFKILFSERLDLVSWWKTMATNDWISSENQRRFDMKGPVVVVDACIHGHGTIWCDMVDGVLHLTSPPVEGQWDKDFVTTNQFLLELRVTVDAILHFFTTNPDAEQLIVVGDNTGVMWCLRSGFCTNKLGMIDLLKIMLFLPRIRFVTVISKNNAADCPSRRYDPKVPDPYVDFDFRMIMTAATIVADFGGRRLGVAEPCMNRGSKLRHAAPADVLEVNQENLDINVDLELSYLYSECSDGLPLEHDRPALFFLYLVVLRSQKNRNQIFLKRL